MQEPSWLGQKGRRHGLTKDVGALVYAIAVDDMALANAQAAAGAARQAFELVRDKSLGYLQVEPARLRWEVAQVDLTYSGYDYQADGSHATHDELDAVGANLGDEQKQMDAAKAVYDALASDILARDLSAAWKEIVQARDRLASFIGVTGQGFPDLSVEAMLAWIDAVLASRDAVDANLALLRSDICLKTIDAVRTQLYATHAQLDALSTQLEGLTSAVGWDDAALNHINERLGMASRPTGMTEPGYVDTQKPEVNAPGHNLGMVLAGQKACEGLDVCLVHRDRDMDHHGLVSANVWDDRQPESLSPRAQSKRRCGSGSWVTHSGESSRNDEEGVTLIAVERPPCTHVGHGVRVALDWDYHRLAHEADKAIANLTAPYPRAGTMYAWLLADKQTLAMWDLTAYMAVEKLGLNDHGQMHAQVVAAHALRLLELLEAGDVFADVISSGAGCLEDAYVVLLAAALLHDLGNQVAREGHEAYSVILAQSVLARVLPDLYSDSAKAQVLSGFILSAIACHDCHPPPFTVEGAVVAVADSADMTFGRGKVAVDQGKVDIHSASAMAIQRVTIGPGEGTPAHIEVVMRNEAGLFQVEKLLAHKLALTGLEHHVSLRACIVPRQGDRGTPYQRLALRGGHLVPERVPPTAKSAREVDPVCGMLVARKQAAGSVVYRGSAFSFCSNACFTHFRDDPSRYVSS